jgi:redox-sensitive bicupin YhaK (pirin superfamily)
MTQAKAQFEIRPFATLGAANHGWLDAYNQFSFGSYHDAARMNWGAIRVWNDDLIAPQSGFPPHPHADMEIITYVRTGAITHKDSLGNEGRTAAGDVQVMSAGSGIRHAEYNLENEPTTLFQIWIMPNRTGGAPNWGAKPFPKNDRAGAWQILASGFDEDDDALPIRTDARVLGATIKAGSSLEYSIGANRHAYMVPATGMIEIDGHRINARDGVAIGEGIINMTAIADTEIVLVDSR